MLSVTVESARPDGESGHWHVPAWMRGDASLVRVSATSVDSGEYGCPEQLAAKARPRVVARGKPSEPRCRYEQFVLGLIMAVLDRHEFRGEPVDQALAAVIDGSTVYEGVERWIRNAVYAYKSSAVTGLGEPLHAVRRQWVVQQRRQRTWELWAWGRRYESDDATLREFRFLTSSPVAHRVRHPTQVAIAAYVVVKRVRRPLIA